MTYRSRSWMNLSFPPFKSRTGLASIVPKRHPAPFSRAAYPHAATFSGVSVNCRFFSTNTNSANAVLIIRSDPLVVSLWPPSHNLTFELTYIPRAGRFSCTGSSCNAACAPPEFSTPRSGVLRLQLLRCPVHRGRRTVGDDSTFLSALIFPTVL